MTIKYNMGIDGEGKGRKNHIYTMLAASNESGSIQHCVENEGGLSTEECLNFILSLPSNARLFGFAFNYDLTMMFKDLPNEELYKLFRPELRKRVDGGPRAWEPAPILWYAPNKKLYKINLIGSLIRISRGKTSRSIWDVFKFYQSSFVKALESWKCSPDSSKTLHPRISVDEMKEMKGNRSCFDIIPNEQIKQYCFDECSYLAELVKKLDQAHHDVLLKDKKTGKPTRVTLRRYDGAGSSAGAFLRIWQIHELRNNGPDEMRNAIACSFFGGRFEHSVIGTIHADNNKPIFSLDISSAYPYQTRFLPCLQHGTWTLSQDFERAKKATTALIHYKFSKDMTGVPTTWGPFPFRMEDGSICYPLQSGGGWVWREEFLAGQRLFPHVRFKKAWVYECSCNCEPPFAQIPICYLNRLKIGKDGAGIVLKLGPNACYGKLAQSLGKNPPFQCWIWAGMITSGTRAQMLEMMRLHTNLDNLLAIATDGLYTLEDIPSPIPKDTGTFQLLTGEKNSKPLGGWELKKIYRPVFFARPGIYFPKNPSEKEVETLRARGIGRANLMACHNQIVSTWESGKENVDLLPITRFGGAKTNITVSHGTRYKRSTRYGQWKKHPVQLSFNPLPKREEILDNNGIYARLSVRTISRRLTSVPYSPSLQSPDNQAMKLAEQIECEQPNGFFQSEYTE